MKALIHGIAVAAIALLVTSTGAKAATLLVDGNLTDLISAVSADPIHGATVSDPLNDAGGKGFDITNVYTYYDTATDTLYFGIKVQGTVGRACTAFFNPPGCQEQNTQWNFDFNENYRFLLDLGSNSTIDAKLMVTGDNGAGTGPDVVNAGGTSIPLGATKSYAASESFNGVEFSITGLNFHGPYTVQLGAGSSVDGAFEDLVSLSSTTVPEPGSFVLLGSGLIAIGALIRKRYQR